MVFQNIAYLFSLHGLGLAWSVGVYMNTYMANTMRFWDTSVEVWFTPKSARAMIFV